MWVKEDFIHTDCEENKQKTDLQVILRNNPQTLSLCALDSVAIHRSQSDACVFADLQSSERNTDPPLLQNPDQRLLRSKYTEAAMLTAMHISSV